jgi:putative component of membrane protein insertase Oxa1/YidC/SpoIIIJ protein YidD
MNGIQRDLGTRIGKLASLILWPLNRLLAICLLWTVVCYRRWISPRKGYKCAAAALDGHTSCSDAAYAALRTGTLSQATRAILAQRKRCQSAAHALRARLLTTASHQINRVTPEAAGAVVAIECCWSSTPPPPPPPPPPLGAAPHESEPSMAKLHRDQDAPRPESRDA